jgi:diguanylate cyclase (GGDEF)-like protein
MIQLSTEAQTTYPSAANFLIVARKAVDLREYAGQLGSQFTAALAKRAPLTPQEQISIERLRGRIDLLNKQLVEQITANDNRVAVKTSIDTVQQRYFNSAIPFVEAQIAIGSINGHYNVDAAGFAARYVPDMDSIVTLRDVLMKEALEDARQSLDETRTAALWLASGNLLILALLGMTLWLINRRVVHPLSKATELILALAQGHLKITIPKSKHQDELAEVLNAIAVLRQNSEERVELEAERQRLVERLRELSNTDSLTGLLNRRCFFELAERVLPTLHRHGHPVTLAIFDIDHFKQVNDSYGHSVGDTVLVELAKLCRERCRSGDIVARFGGEEFVIMMPYCNIKEGAGQAERLRRYIEALRIPLPQGGELHISASFGVETCLPSDTSIHEVIKRADERLYVAKNTERNQVIWHDVPLD